MAPTDCFTFNQPVNSGGGQPNNNSCRGFVPFAATGSKSNTCAFAIGYDDRPCIWQIHPQGQKRFSARQVFDKSWVHQILVVS